METVYTKLYFWTDHKAQSFRTFASALIYTFVNFPDFVDMTENILAPRAKTIFTSQ